MTDSRCTATDEAMLETLAVICEETANIVLRFAGRATHRLKDDRSPVSEADEAAHAHIAARLKEHFPHILAVSEEDSVPQTGAMPERYFLIDPIDGTKSFIRGKGAYTVNIGLIEELYPRLGVISDPVGKVTYAGGPDSAMKRVFGGAWRAIRVNGKQQDLHALLSYSGAEREVREWAGNLNITSVSPLASSLKFCKLAEGAGDLYVRFGPTSEWDTAAGQAILEAAGGRVETLNGKRFAYGKPGLRNGNFAAYGW